MSKRIVVTDPEIRKLEDRCIRQLDEFYPNHVIERAVDCDHKMLAARLGKARKLIGYETRSDMLNAWGFETMMHVGGRPVSFDGGALFAEIAKRYKDREKPASIRALVDENPDLKRQMKTASNKATELFGRTLAKELEHRGLLAEKAKKKSVARVEEQPSYENVTDSELMEAVIEASDALRDQPSADKPKSMRALGVCSNYGALVCEAERRKLVTEDFLCEAGILNPSVQYLKKYSVRMADVGELSSAAANTLGISYIKPAEPDSDKLPPYVCGIDLDAGLELRRVAVAGYVGSAQFDCGDEYELDGSTGWWQTLNVMLPEPIRFGFRTSPLFDGWTNRDDSALSSCVGAKVVGTFELKNEGLRYGCLGYGRYAWFQLTYLASLRSETLVYLLHRKGIVRDSDLAGGMGWRYRLGLIDFDSNTACS